MNRFYIFLKFFVVGCLVLFLVTNTRGQTEVSIAPTKDNTLYETTDGSVSNGAGQRFFVGRVGTGGGQRIRRGLLAFDIVGNVSEGATITSVTLTLNMSRTTSGSQNISLHRALADWGEGSSDASGQEGSGASSSTNDATWLHQFFNTDLWTNLGGDFEATSSANQAVGSPGTYTWDSTAQMVADVQAWLDDSANNFGWVLLGNESTGNTSKRFDTKENPTEANRPVLTVIFTPTTSVEDRGDSIPTQFSLAQNYPNPFNPSTTIQYTIANNVNTAIVRLDIHNILGQKIRSLVNERQAPGSYSVQWNGNLSASGVYFYRLQVGDFMEIKKMILMQ